jgi:DNA-binding MarR family transcriptional regulator
MKKSNVRASEVTLQEMQDLAPICAFNNLRVISRLVERLYDEAFRSANISASQVALLWTVLAAEPVSMKSLTSFMSADQTTLSRVVARAIEMKLLALKKDGADGRIKLISLTALGREKLCEIYSPWKHVQDEVAQMFDLETPRKMARKARQHEKASSARVQVS